MKAERLLQIGLATMATLGTLLLGYGQESFYPPMFAAAAAVLSVLFTDILGIIRLNKIVANLAALVAAIVVLFDFFTHDYGPNRLLSIANLLICLQVVLFFQQKNTRIYWQLAVLSLLQVVVAAALGSGPFFGGVLITYMVLGLATMSVFYVYRESIRGGGERSPRRSFQKSSEATAVVAPGVHQQRLLTGGFGLHMLGLVVATLGMAFLLYLVSPHFGAAEWHGGDKDLLVGFPDEVSLGHMGRILESDEQVMRVHYYSDTEGKPYQLVSNPYLRGRVLSEYFINDEPISAQNENEMGRTGWRVSPRRRSTRTLPLAPVGAEVVYQDIILEPGKESTLFTAAPAFGLPGGRVDIRFDPQRGELKYDVDKRNDDDARPESFRYLLATTGFRNGWQAEVTAHENRLSRPYDRMNLYYDLKHLLIFHENRFPKLKSIADKVIADANLQNANANDRAKALFSHFRQSRNYRYSLDFREIKRDTTIDPIEDFVANHRTGHCQYFASALVMMLRSQGIPARVVVGYHASEFNNLGGYFLVRQRDAHAWVEAFLEPSEINPSEMGNNTPGPAGGWLRLDPTPAATVAATATDSFSIQSVIDNTLDFAQFLWRDYIVGETTGQTDYDNSINSSAEDIQKEGLTALLLAAVPAGWMRDWASENQIFAVSTLAGLLCALLLVGVLVWRFIKRRRRSPVKLAANSTRNGPKVEFYERLAGMLKKAGGKRAKSQTQREFVAGVADETNASLFDPIISAFYRVRFGNHELTEREQAEVELALDHLEKVLGQPA